MSVMEKKQVERVFHLYSKAKQCAVNKGWGHKLDEGKKTDFWIAAHWFASGSLLSDGGRAPMGGKKKKPSIWSSNEPPLEAQQRNCVSGYGFSCSLHAWICSFNIVM